jgi:hypothetical protein
MKALKILIFFLAPLAFSKLSSQMVVSPSNEIPVFNELGNPLPNAWCGGINAAHISMFDADFDGEQDDLFIFDKAGNRTLVFEGIWNGDQKEYHYMPDVSNQFPPLLNFALLRDYNCDGKKDIFTYSSQGGGMAVYENTSSGNLSFNLVIPLLNSWYPFSGGFSTNIFVSSQDVPAIFDFEGDGDLDVLTFGVSGSTVELHFNNSMETQGFCSLDNMELANRCYGKFIEASEDNMIIQDSELFDQICGFNVPDPKSNKRGGTGDARHIGSTILAFDATQDGLADLVIGDVSFNNLTYLENSEGSGVDSVVYVADDFPADFNAPAVDLDNFPAGFYEDVSGDGIRDLLVGVNNGDVAANRNSVYYYENIGQDDLPEFSFIQDNFIQAETIDFGESSAPALVDVNGDGLLDIVLGSRGEFLGLTEFKPRLSLFINSGTANAPSFDLESEEWIDLDALGIGQYPDPEFGDLDGDGDLDLLLGENSGAIHHFENTAGQGNEMDLNYIGLLPSSEGDLDVGQKSSPQLFDLNNDNLLDLIVGERNGNINYYENIGTVSNPVFSFVTDTLGGLTTVEAGMFIGSSAPHFFELNGITYLATGSESGRTHLYNGIDGNIDGDFSLITLSGFDINTGLMNNPFIANINNDDYLDVIVGGIGGGLNLYLGYGFLSTESVQSNQDKMKLFPNPAQDIVRIEGIESAASQVEIFTVDGQLVDSFILNSEAAFSVAPYKSGVFLVRVISDRGSQVLKLVKK